MNKAILPLASLCVLGAYSIVLGFLCHDSWVTAAVNNLILCMGIKYRRSRTLNKTKFQHFFSEMNKTNLPLASLCVFWA